MKYYGEPHRGHHSLERPMNRGQEKAEASHGEMESNRDCPGMPLHGDSVLGVLALFPSK